MQPTFPTPIPEIPITNLPHALHYYTQNLGFTQDWSDESLGLAGISRGPCRLFLATAELRQHYNNAGPTLIWLNLNSIDEVNALHHEWSLTHANILSAPESKPYGLHEFTASDLDGNLFRVFYDFATPTQSKR